MPNNDNNFDLPKSSDDVRTETLDLNENNNAEVKKNIIDIPQEYYDKVAKENQFQQEREAAILKDKEEIKANSVETQGLLIQAIINAIVIFALLYATVNVSWYLFFGIPVIIFVLSMVIGLKERENTTYPASVMVGGIICAVIAFVISMIKEDEADLYMYYAIACAVVGFLGYAISSIISKYINKGSEIKALETIGYLLFFGALIAVPYYFAKNYHEEFYKILFHTQVEVKAETEEEFVYKTIKARYNIEFTCNEKYTKNYLNEHNRKQKVRGECTDSNGVVFSITSIAYNEGSNQYVVADTYLDTVLLINAKEKLADEIKNVTNANKVTISLYPEKNCFFYGDCVDCDEYYERYKEENDIENQYSISSTANFEKYLKKDSKQFINDMNFKYVINLYGSYNDSTYQNAILSIFDVLNNNGYKNNYGFVINLYRDYSQEELQKLAFVAVGNTNASKKFETFELDTNKK